MDVVSGTRIFPILWPDDESFPNRICMNIIPFLPIESVTFQYDWVEAFLPYPEIVPALVIPGCMMEHVGMIIAIIHEKQSGKFS